MKIRCPSGSSRSFADGAACSVLGRYAKATSAVRTLRATRPDPLELDPAHVLRTPKKREALPDVLDRTTRGNVFS